MRIGILGSVKKQKTEKNVQSLLKELKACGYEAVVFQNVGDIDDVDVVIVLGGDGAILHAAVVAAQKGIKIIGVNHGTLGFLTEYEKDEEGQVKDLLSALENNACRIVKRSVLQVQIGERTYYALNEVSIQRDYAPQENEPQMLSLALRAKEGVDTISGDGLLICTPTGSTAYSLSAGGAIITPEVPVFMMTPICAFSMRARPIVFSDSDEFNIRVTRGKGMVLTDGGAVAQLPEAGEVFIKKAPFTADFPIKDEAAFLGRVRNKLNG